MFYQVFKSIDDVLWRDVGCATELDSEQTLWMLLSKYLDDLENEEVECRMAGNASDDFGYVLASTLGEGERKRKMVLTRSFRGLVQKGVASDLAFRKAPLRKGTGTMLAGLESDVGRGPNRHEGARV